MRNVIDRDVQDVATDLADDFVTRCEPAYDAIAVVEPGIALAWPGIRARADEELARRRSWRARCLARRGDPADVAAERAKEQVQLVVDEHAEVRRDVLAGADPSGDIVVAAYGPRGEALSATRVDATAHYAARERVVAATIVAVARASGAPERATSSSPGPDRR